MHSDPRKTGCGAGCFGWAGVIVGIAFILAGWVLQQPQVTRTTGVIVQSTPAAYGQTRRIITYEYTVGGTDYHNQCFIYTWRPYVGRYDVGKSFPVYYVTDHPEQSYAPSPPTSSMLIAFGCFPLLFGAVFLIFGRPR